MRTSIESLEGRILFSAGDSVATFGTGGVSVFYKTLRKVIPSQVVTFSDEKILIGVAAQYSTDTSAVTPADFVEINANGTPVTTFGTAGAGYADSAFGSVQAVTPLGNGKFLALGLIESEHSYVARFLANGSLDTSYGTNGMVELSDYGTLGNAAEHARVYNDGSVLAVFGSNLIRFNADGSIDTSYGSNGRVTLAATSQRSAFDLSDIAFSDSGETYLLGSRTSGSTTHNVVRKMTAAGTMDTSFGTAGSGEVEFNKKLALGAIAIVSDGIAVTGDIPLNGKTYGEITELIKLDTSGQFDSSFGTAGIASEQVAEQGAAQQIAEQADGKLVTAGNAGDYDRNYGTTERMVRYNADGTRDLTFGELRVADNSVTLITTTYDGQSLLMANESRITELSTTNISAPVASISHTGTLTLNGSPRSEDLSITEEYVEVVAKYGTAPDPTRPSDYQLTRDTWSRVLPAAGVKRIVINGSGGDDVLTSPTTKRPVTLNGDSGNDTLLAGHVRVFYGVDHITAKNGAVLNGGDGNDTIIFFGNDIVANGDAGNDRITGNFIAGAPDTITGGAGNDRLISTGPADVTGFYLFGNEGNDTLISGHSSDLLYGGPGKDSLDGDSTRDQLFPDGN